jgi:hypothetical protein
MMLEQLTLRGLCFRLLGAAGLLAFLGWCAPAAGAAPPTTVDFSSSDNPQSWTVPAGVYQATFDLFGSVGGGGDPGAGGESKATIAVSPGQTYWIITGGLAQPGNPFLPFPPPSSVGGGGGAFPSGGPGGGATDVRADPGDVGTRLLVAGGGGGAGGAGIALEGTGELDLAGGTGGVGGLNPSPGTAGQPYGDPVIYSGGSGGGAATSTAPGPGGSSPVTGGHGHDGSGPVGGSGGPAPPYETFNPAGAGGGGGCLGGGGGGAGLNQPRATTTAASGGGGGGGGTSCVYASTIGSALYNDGVSSALGHATVTFDAPQEQPISAQPKTFGSSEGSGFNGTVATFSDPDSSASATEYSATIDWGDGSPTSSGAISGTGGEFSVDGAHTFPEEGSYSVIVKITDVDNPSNAATATSTANVADAALTSQCAASATSPQSFSGPTATFTDANPGGQGSDYAATIDWGDGASSAGTVSSGTGSGPYSVTGSHSYGSTGPFTVTSAINDAGGSHTVATCKTLIFASAPGGGSFTIGDNNSATGMHVLFWGAQWSKRNSLSAESPPPSFKGFASNRATAGCGTTWSTGPGNSSPAPGAPLPAYMAVIVTSSVSNAGSAITGDTPSMVVVKTEPGYAPDPGHPGTGTVIAKIC